MTTRFASWPRISWETCEWHESAPEGISRRAALRSRGPYEAAVPPMIAGLTVPALSPQLAADAEDAVVELTRFDSEYGAVTAPFSAILLRSESAASSEIEALTASAKNIALAELGRRAGGNSRLIVGNVRAMEAAIALSADLDADAIIRMQREILVDDSPEHTGGWREQQVWIGGGLGQSPHGAAFVAPHASRVADLMDDLVAFARRTDLPGLVQSALAHAQFETIHPFPDGNGRTGRALIHSLLHRLGVTRGVTVPVSAGLLRDTRAYFDALTAYRDGDIEPVVRTLVAASFEAVTNGRELVADLVRIRDEWEQAASARAGSTGRRLLDLLARQPIVDAGLVARWLDVDVRSAQNGIDRLVGDGILRQLGTGLRNRLFEAREVFDALDAFADRAKRRR